MPDTSDANFVGPVETPLTALGREMEQDIASGKIGPAELERYEAAVRPHAEAAKETVTELTDYIKAEPQHFIDVTHDATADFLASRHEHPDAAVEPREAAALVQPFGHELLDAQEHIVTGVLDIQEQQVGAWREIVEVRAERGDESEHVVQAQREEVERLHAQIEHARADIHDASDWAHGELDARVNYVMEHNDASVLQPHETIDAGHYNLPAGEHELPLES